jgi:tetratricopeptide (TPR) repeat protein
MPTIPEALNAAVRHHQAGQLAQAEQIYRQVLSVDPLQYDAWHLLGLTLHQQGQSDASIQHIREALRLKPDFPEAHYNLGNVLRDLSRPAEAAASYQQALRWRPNSAETHYNLGNALNDLHQYAAAAECYQQAVRLKPNYQKALNNLGNCYMDLERHGEAAEVYQQVLANNPTYPKGHSNLGNALRQLGRTDEAVASCRRALELEPNNAEALNNLAAALLDQGQTAEAIAAFDQSIEQRPDYAEARMNRGMAWLMRGDYARGWEEYEWRWRSKAFVPRGFSQPQWDGSPLAGRTILVHAEQGLGDTLQFLRYVPAVKERGGTVLLECSRVLHKLVEKLAGVDRRMAFGDELPPFDVHVPLLSLPHVLGLIEPRQMNNVPYLHPDAHLREKWDQHLAAIPGFKVGINWQGNPKYPSDRQRSLPLAHFLPLTELPDVRLISLQKNFGIEQLQELKDPAAVLDLGSQLDNESGPFMDTAAVMTNLDLVITCNTAIAHLAGAVGARVWVLLSTAPDWRFLTHGETTDWYPTMRLFRQQKSGQWGPVMEQVVDELQQMIGETRMGSEI